jgi:hypothetical protein
MDHNRFGITAQGVVYRKEPHDWILLGHISCVAREQTKLGQDVRAWWHARLASDGPSHNLIVPGGGIEPHLVAACLADKTFDSQNPVPPLSKTTLTIGDADRTCVSTQIVPPSEDPCPQLI